MESVSWHAGGDIQSNASAYYKVKYHYTSMEHLEKYSSQSKFKITIMINLNTVQPKAHYKLRKFI